MNKFELYQQRLENKENIKTIKNNSKEINNMIFIISLITFFNTIFNIIGIVFTTSIYKLLEQLIEKL